MTIRVDEFIWLREIVEKLLDKHVVTPEKWTVQNGDNMAKNKEKIIDPIPENFTSIEEAAQFWDAHSLADYWDQTSEVEIEVHAPRRQWVPLAANLASQAAERARQEGVSVETLVNLWIAEKLHTGL